MPIKPGRGGAVTRPKILPVQNLSPQGENRFIPLREIRKTAFFGGRVDAPPLQEDNTKNDTIDISTILPYCDHDRFLPTPVPGAFRKRWILERPKNMPPACFLNGLKVNCCEAAREGGLGHSNPASPSPKKIHPKGVDLFWWRSSRDSNPGDAFTPYEISSHASSTSLSTAP